MPFLSTVLPQERECNRIKTNNKIISKNIKLLKKSEKFKKKIN